ncbi:MAG: Asp-tRNA(Asn)/Glu-tRNA(Gln) amidotransferase GatCAB subunit B, partial [Legionellales bacterium]|nr:Asp-tRNA(Asn)/Glu-tRNA(Gln) amidotransferase GatCAB subunit B [Legionellales bacterium]
SISESPISHKQLAHLLDRIHDQTISGKIAKTVFEAMWQGQGSADQIIEQQGLQQVTDTTAIAAIIDDIIANNPQQVEQYRSGKDKLFGFFVGQVMKCTQGKANPQQVNELLREKLQ